MILTREMQSPCSPKCKKMHVSDITVKIFQLGVHLQFFSSEI